MFNTGDRVIITPCAFTRAGNTGTIVLIEGDNASVRFDDGEELSFIISDGELTPQATMPLLITRTAHANA